MPSKRAQPVQLGAVDDLPVVDQSLQPRPELARAVELQKLDCMEREAWDAWRRSQEPAESTRVIQQGSERRAERRVTQQHGDRRFLELLLRTCEARRALLGLDAPTRIAPTSPDGQQPYLRIDWDALFCDDDPIERKIRGVEQSGSTGAADTDGQNNSR